MKPIVNSLTPSAIRAEHSEIENLRLENKNLVAQLDSSRSELATAQRKCDEFRADALRYQWLRSKGINFINWDGLTTDTSDTGLDHAIDSKSQWFACNCADWGMRGHLDSCPAKQ